MSDDGENSNRKCSKHDDDNSLCNETSTISGPEREEALSRLENAHRYMLDDEYFERYGDDEVIMLAAVDNNNNSFHEVLRDVSVMLKNDKEFVLEVIARGCDEILYHASREVLDDREFALRWIEK